MPTELLPLAALLLPCIAAILVIAFRRKPNIREASTLGSALALVAVVTLMLPRGLAEEMPVWVAFELAPGLPLALQADAAGLLFALFASVLWLLTSIYSIGYVRSVGEAKQTRYYTSFAVCLASTVGLAFSANLLTFFLFYELLTIATYPLVVHKESPEALRAGRRYLAYLLTGGVALLFALAFIYATTGDVTFRAGGFLAGTMGSGELILLALLFTIGFGTKSAIMPLHAWLPSAMVAPTPVSALLHAVAVVKAGVFGFARAIGYVLGPEVLADIGVADVLALVAALTILVASGMALAQDNLKRRLAFSTIAHLSYIVLGLAIASATAWSGALLHIANHALLKITLFFCAGAIYATAHLDRVSQLDGIGRRMPVTMSAFALASIGLAGLPPFGGFWSKLFLALGAVDAGVWPYAVVLLVSGLLTAGYLFPIVYRAFFRPTPPDTPLLGEATPFMAAPLAVTALLALILGFGDPFSVAALVTSVTEPVIGGSP